MDIKIGKNQYLLTTDNNITGYCEKYKIGGYYLYTGEDCRVYDSGTGIHVIGYAVDIINPKHGMLEMCEKLATRITDGTIGPQATRNWNGRWVVIVELNKDIIIWHDCCGLKQCFYYVSGDNIEIASQARYIAALHGFNSDKDALAYIDFEKRFDKEYSMPLDKSLYKEIRRLLPNHYIHDSIIERADITSVKGSVSSTERIISDSLKAIQNKEQLVLTLTAGWDSRLVLAGINSKDGVEAVTLKYDWMADDNIDITTASKLAELVGINHRVICCKNTPRWFSEKYMEHSENGHEYWIQMAYAVIDGGYSSKLWVKGSCNEIVRNSFGILYNWQVSEHVICKLYGLGNEVFALKAVKDWLTNARPYCKKNRISLLDLFYWEHRMGSWLSECLNEADISGEMFSPFNSRCYLENGFGIQASKRIAPKYSLFQQIIINNNLPANDINKGRYDSFKSIVKLVIKNKLHILYGLLIK